MAVTNRSLGSLSLFLRGFDHESTLEAYHDIQHSNKLILLREPENRHDQNPVRATDSEDRLVGRVARKHAQRFNSMLLALLSTGVCTEVIVAQFKDKGGWKNTEVHFDITFTTDSAKFKNGLSALNLSMQHFNDLYFCPVADFYPVDWKTNTSQCLTAGPVEI